MDLYQLLEVSRSATEDDIKASYRKLAMKYHPDRTQGDKVLEEKFKTLKAAYETLIDPERRRIYDDTGSSAELTSEDVDAMQFLLNVFNSCVQEHMLPLHILLISRARLYESLNQVVAQRNHCNAERERCASMQGKIKVKEGKRNLVDMLITQKLRDLDNVISNMDRREKVCRIAAQMLEDHSVNELMTLARPTNH